MEKCVAKLGSSQRDRFDFADRRLNILIWARSGAR